MSGNWTVREVYTPPSEANGSEPALAEGNPFSFRRGEKLGRDDDKTVSEEKNGVVIRQWFWLFSGDRAGYVPYNPLDPNDNRSPAIELTDDIPPPFQTRLFEDTIPIEIFAENCLRKAIRWDTNAAYLYALGFIESGDEWPEGQVGCPDGTEVVGTFRFLRQTWRTLVDKLGNEQNIGVEDIRFPEPQTTFAASQAADAVAVLGTKLSQPPTFLQLYLSHLFTIEGCVAISGFAKAQLEGSFDETIQQVVNAIDPSAVAARVTDLMERKKKILLVDGKCLTTENALKALADELDRGFAEVKKVATDLVGTQLSALGPVKGQDIGPDTLGVLSEEFESKGDPGIIGWDRVGGFSYGKYQISAGKNVFAQFMNFLKKIDAYANIWQTLTNAGGAAAAKSGDKEFGNTFKGLKNDPLFTKCQWEFIKASHYDAMVAALQGILDVPARSNALQNVVWSVAVQHGPRSPIVKICVNAVDASSDLALINAIYDERSKVNLYFANQTHDVRESVRKRFIQERAMAIRMLNSSIS